MTTQQEKPASQNDSHDALLAHESANTIKHYAFPEGTTLFRKGEHRHCAYLIDKGEVHIYGNDEGGEDKLLCVLGESEIFGEMALIDDTPRTATAITASDAEIFVIPRDALYERIQGLDPIVSLLMSLLVERYRITRIHLPESMKQDRARDFLQKISKYENLPENALRIHDTSEAMDIARKELQLEQDLRRGLKEKEFVPVLQPILKLPEQKLVGFEALIRWEHPDKGLVMPDDFIPVAEHTNVVQHLDRMMLEKVCEVLPGLSQDIDSEEKLFISVNLSGINFGTVDIVKTIKDALNKSLIDPTQLKLEITESALVLEPEKAEKALRGIKDLGIKIALDDFGTGYSSLGYLHQFPIDIIKIDRSFVSRLHEGNKSYNIVSAIVSLAKTFKLKTVAEGIETAQDVDTLNLLHCDMGQGYLFSKPLSLADAYEFTKKHRTQAA